MVDQVSKTWWYEAVEEGFTSPRPSGAAARSQCRPGGGRAADGQADGAPTPTPGRVRTPAAPGERLFDRALRRGRRGAAPDRAAPGSTVGIGAGAAGDSAGHERGGVPGLATQDMVLNIGPQHPATHGVLRLRLTLDGERIVDCEPIVGYMHRGVEKLFEVRDYRQIIVLANRHDWLSAFSSELGRGARGRADAGHGGPRRAVWIRTLLAELNRVLNHLMFLGSYPIELGAITPIFYAFRERETIQAVMEEVSGGRMHYMFNRVGGLKEDIPAGWLGRVGAAVGAVRGGSPRSRTWCSATRSSGPAPWRSGCCPPN